MTDVALDMSLDFNCPACALAVPSGFVFCPRCRAAGEGRDYDPQEVDSHERHYVVSLVVLSLGALALPRLFRSKAFSAVEKAGLGLVGVLNTASVAVVCVWFANWLPIYLRSLQQQ